MSVKVENNVVWEDRLDEMNTGGSGHSQDTVRRNMFGLDKITVILHGIVEDRYANTVVIYILLSIVLALVVTLVYRQVSCFLVKLVFCR